MPSGLNIKDLAVLPGEGARRGDRVTIRYDGFLNRGDPFQTGGTVSFVIGRREVIAGLDYGVEGMVPGARRRLRVSPHLAYGARGVPGLIPPNAKLIFDIELLSLQRAGP